MSFIQESQTSPELGGIERLYGSSSLQSFRRSTAMVIGIGGVGSWTAEALARSGVGKLVLVDMDDLCVTNTNRQIHATTLTLGQGKVDAMADRIRSISNLTQVQAERRFFTARSAEELLSLAPDIVVDAIDSTQHKALLIAECLQRQIPLVVSGAAGGRRDPTCIRKADLAQTTHDPLLKSVRKLLRDTHGIEPGPDKGYGIPAVYSQEKATFPVCDQASPATRAPGLRIDCATGYGTVTAVTGGFGFAAAQACLDILASRMENPIIPRP